MSDVQASDELELTRSQWLLWLGQELHPRTPLYNMVLTFDIAGAVDPAHFERAFAALVGGCDALRTVIETVDGAPRRVIRPDMPAAVEHVDLSDARSPDDALRAWVAGRSTRVFEPGAPLFDTALIRLSPERWVWYLNQHHLITDAWSTALVYRHVAELYGLSRAGRLDEARPLPPYGAFAAHERSVRASPLHRRVREHWEQKLARPVEPVRPYGRRATSATTVTRRVTRDLGVPRSERVRRVAAEADAGALTGNAAVFQLFAAALLAFLYRVGDQRRLAIGVPSHNRASAAFKETVGAFVELFPFVADLDDDESFASLLEKVRRETGSFLRYAQPGTSTPGAHRAFNVVLNFIHASFPAFDGLPMRSEWVHAGHGDSRHHLRVQVHDFDASGSFLLHLDFNAELFGPEEREAAADQLLRVLDALLDDPGRPIREVDLLGPRERQRVLAELGRPAAPPAAARTVLELFDEQLARTPGARAVLCDDRELSYVELDRAARGLAGRLADHGVGRGSRVALFAERGPEAVIAVLAVLRAGGAFVPLSPDDGPERIGHVLRDAAPDVLLTQQALRTRLPPHGAVVVALDPYARGDEEVDGSAGVALPGDPAYVLYTSGSTGSPKGVVVEHDALARYLAWARTHYLRDEPHDFPLFTSLAFDLTLTSLLLPLVVGGAVVVYRDDATGVPALLRVVEEARVDALKLTPSHLSLLRGRAPSGSRVRALIVGGEELRAEQARGALRTFPAAELFNEFGPTEATIGCMVHRFDPERDGEPTVPIGRAAGDATIYLLDDGLNPVPPGVVGEITVSGPAVARGYLHRPEATAERFLADPFRPGARMYRTGDLGRWRGDGVMEYLGRRDRQVKIRGARVEPAEVESALSSHPAIDACVVDVARASESRPHGSCARCGLPSTYPGATFDERGVCHLCRGFEGYQERVRDYFRTMDDLEDLFASLRAGRAADHDCVLLLSGGKDSTYALYRLVGMGVRVLAFTLDNGYLSDEAKANIRRVTEALGVEHVFGTTPAMNEIFVDSLKRFSNVCNGCFKTIYTLGTRLARERGIPAVVTGLSRGQFFETRLTEELFRDDGTEAEDIDRMVLEARKAYHRADDAVARLLATGEFRDDALFEDIRYVDFYRYCDVQLDDMLEFLAEHAPWIRPGDTGRSTNCLINEVGILVHRRERGFHNYAFPYSWDVRVGHKSRDEAMAELDEDIDPRRVEGILAEIGYDAPLPEEETEARLVAYVTAGEPVSDHELRAHLARRLPDYMIPARFVRLDELPLTPHGKVDRAALPSAAAPRSPQPRAAHVAPRSPAEERVAAIWAEVLELPRVGALDEFLDLGGNSLLAIQIIARVNRAFEVELPLQSAFEASTVAAFARLLESALLDEIAGLSESEVRRLTSSP